jgi:signal transduction histidine kinase
MVDVDIARLLRDLAATLRGVLDPRIGLQLDLPGTPLRFACDPRMLEDAIIDLVRLARDAIDEEGVITLGAQATRGGTARGPARVMLKVACTAWHEEMPHSDPASRFARALDGSLTVAGTPANGTVMTLSLPVESAERAWVQRVHRQLQRRS